MDIQNGSHSVISSHINANILVVFRITVVDNAAGFDANHLRTFHKISLTDRQTP